MKKYSFRLILALLAALLLVACGPSEEEKQKAADAAAKADAMAKENAALIVPKEVTDKAAWQNYFKAALTKFLRENASTVKTNHLYTYYVPTGDGDEQKNYRATQLEDVKNSVARGGVAGNLWAFVGPDSAATADQVIAAFKDVQAGAFKGVFIVFAGSLTDSDRVKEAVEKGGADYHFIQVK
jgi:hypothetical protein